MPSFNRVLVMGNITRDPQLKFLPNQTAVCEFGIAMNRKWKAAGGEDREEVCFVDIAFFGKVAEVINQHFTKGKPIFIEGRLKYDAWEDKNGGGKRSKLSIIGDTFQFVGGKEDGEQRPPRQSANRQTVPPDDQSGPGIPDDDVPFSPCKL